MKDNAVLPLGSFEVKSGSLIVSDPCYEREERCCGSVVNAANGKWFAAARLRTYHYKLPSQKEPANDTRVRELLAWTEPVVWKGNQVYGGGPWEELSFAVGVDSGQAGVFDDKAYQDNKYGEQLLREQWAAGKGNLTPADAQKDPEPCYWYWAVCNLTAEGAGGALQGGVCVSSGFGDGNYSAYYRRWSKAKLVVAIKIVFL